MLTPSRIRREVDKEIAEALRQRRERRLRRSPPPGLLGALLALLGWVPRLPARV
jgi:hypothetical protein